MTAGSLLAKLLKAEPGERMKLARQFEKQSSKQLGGAKVTIGGSKRGGKKKRGKR